MNMEDYEGCVGFDLCETPLSSVAQKIMYAMRSGDLADSKNWGESTKTTELVNKSSVKYSVPLEDEKIQSVGKKTTNPLISQTSRGSATLSPHASRPRLTGAACKKSTPSLALSSCSVSQCHPEASGLPKMEQMREHFLKGNVNNKNKENMNLKRQHDSNNNSSENTSKDMALEESADEAKAPLNSGDSRAFKTHFCDIRDLGDLAKGQLMEALQQAAALVVTLMYKDGSTQLRADQALTSSVKGIVMLLKSQVEAGSALGLPCRGALQEGLPASDQCIYIQTECTSLWGQGQETYSLFARNVLFQTLKCKCPVVCFNAKDFVRTVLQFFGDDGSWKHVADFVGLDPRIAAWLIDPSDAVPSFEKLVAKHLGESITVNTSSTHRNSSRNAVNQNVCVNLDILYRLTVDLCSKLKVYGLWRLFCTLELPLIPILAVMESHKIQVNRDEMERTSALLGARLKELEEEAHFVAGEQFLIMSNNQVREVLFGKLKLHLLRPRRSLPTAGPQQRLSTSEAVLTSLQDLHPLPKIILEYRQVHKIKSTFVDGLLVCMKKNIQGISKHPIHITKPQNFKGKEDETLMISPRALFVSSEGHTFLAADFSQIELRILAHLSGDPELLKLFQESRREDVFSTLTSQWKDLPLEHVTQADRERTKKVVYSVIYGAAMYFHRTHLSEAQKLLMEMLATVEAQFQHILEKINSMILERTMSRTAEETHAVKQAEEMFKMGKERLAACLGVSIQEATQFLESFMQRYKKIKDFAQATIAHCQHTGYVTSIMGRRRPLPRIHTQNQQLRAQAERQAVNFVVQGSAADLCKMAMIRVFAAVATSPTLTARLVAQIHDELLFEVEDAQVPEFAALVRRTMESLQQVQTLELQLQVPLKVNLSAGRSWGRLVPLQEAPGP